MNSFRKLYFTLNILSKATITENVTVIFQLLFPPFLENTLKVHNIQTIATRKVSILKNGIL